jgi:hypothetical protein
MTSKPEMTPSEPAQRADESAPAAPAEPGPTASPDLSAGAEKEGTEPLPAAEPAPASSPKPPLPEEEGWPRSWIVTAVVLGIVAVIIVARLAGQSWRLDDPEVRPGEHDMRPRAKQETKEKPETQERPDEKRPEEKQEKPERPELAPAPTGAWVKLLEVKNLSAKKGGRYCIGRDALHAVQERPWPAACLLDIKGSSSFRVELLRGDDNREIGMLFLSSEPEVPPLLHVFINPRPGDSRPVWYAGTVVATPGAAVIVEAPGEGFTIRSFRFAVER